MRVSPGTRRHLAALRALLLLTVVCGVVYPLMVTGIAQVPGLHAQANGSTIKAADGRPLGSRLIGQLFTGKGGAPLPQYFHSRPSAAGQGYDPTASGASNLGPEDIRDTLPDPTLIQAGKQDPNARQSLLTQVCSRSKAVGELEGVDGSRPFCAPSGVGAVLALLGPRNAAGHVSAPTRVVSINEQCPAKPFLATYRGVTVECAEHGQDYATGEIVPIRGKAPAKPAVPADAVTASGSGLDPDISPAYARLQAPRIARVRRLPLRRVLDLVGKHTTGRTLGFMGAPHVNVVQLNRDLDRRYPVPG